MKILEGRYEVAEPFIASDNKIRIAVVGNIGSGPIEVLSCSEIAVLIGKSEAEVAKAIEDEVGSYPWIDEEGVAISCCTDGMRPVIFRIERIED